VEVKGELMRKEICMSSGLNCWDGRGRVLVFKQTSLA